MTARLLIAHLRSSFERIVIHPVRSEEPPRLPAGALAFQLRGHFGGISVLGVVSSDTCTGFQRDRKKV
jgi:hypothetical protein